MEYNTQKPNTYKAVSGLVVDRGQLLSALSLHVNVNYITEGIVLSKTILPYEPTEKVSWFRKEDPPTLYGEIDWVRIRHNSHYNVINVECQISVEGSTYTVDIYGKQTNECDKSKDKFYRLGVGIVVRTFSIYKDIPTTYLSWWGKLKVL